MKRVIKYAIPSFFLILIADACINSIEIPGQVFVDGLRGIGYTIRSFNGPALVLFYWSAALFLLGYLGFYFISKTKIKTISFGEFVLMGQLLQFGFGIFLFASMIDGNSRMLGLNFIVLVVLIAPLTINRLYEIAN